MKTAKNYSDIAILQEKIAHSVNFLKNEYLLLDITVLATRINRVKRLKIQGIKKQ